MHVAGTELWEPKPGPGLGSHRAIGHNDGPTGVTDQAADACGSVSVELSHRSVGGAHISASGLATLGGPLTFSEVGKIPE
jgi:hypothetical protein